jgi:protein SCO1/2
MKPSVATLFILPGIFTLFLSCKTEDPLPILGFPEVDENGVEVHHRVDEFVFVNQNSDTFASTDKEGIFVMNYFFTTCPTICPKMTDNIATVFDRYENNKKVNFISLTVDPNRDNPARLKSYMESHQIPLNENWQFLTGDKTTLYGFARYQLFLSALEAEVEIDDDFIHSEKVVLVDADRHIRGYYTGTEFDDMKRLSRDIKRLLRINSKK